MGYRQFPALQAKQIKVTQLFAIWALLWLFAPFPREQLKSKSEGALLKFSNDYTWAESIFSPDKIIGRGKNIPEHPGHLDGWMLLAFVGWSNKGCVDLSLCAKPESKPPALLSQDWIGRERIPVLGVEWRWDPLIARGPNANLIRVCCELFSPSADCNCKSIANCNLSCSPCVCGCVFTYVMVSCVHTHTRALSPRLL